MDFFHAGARLVELMVLSTGCVHAEASSSSSRCKRTRHFSRVVEAGTNVNTRGQGITAL